MIEKNYCYCDCSPVADAIVYFGLGMFVGIIGYRYYHPVCEFVYSFPWFW